MAPSSSQLLDSQPQPRSGRSGRPDPAQHAFTLPVVRELPAYAGEALRFASTW